MPVTGYRVQRVKDGSLGFGHCVEKPISRGPQTGLQPVKNGRQQRRASQRNREQRRVATTMRQGTVWVNDPLVY